MLDTVLREFPADSAVVLNNGTCWYCGSRFGDPGVVWTKEHAIGRRFVPRGKLDRRWNLIGWACRKCNGRKADLENDISAITMQPDQSGRYSESSFSRLTGKPVKDSRERITLRGPYAPGVEFKFEATAGPQVSSARAYELARMQLMALFYFLTFDPQTRTGRYWRGNFIGVMETARSDWGNPVMRGFADTVVNWDASLLVSTADGFFKAAIRRHAEVPCWSWALEWNMKYRIVGFFGDRATAETIVFSCRNSN